MRVQGRAGELAPVEDRIRWMLLCRVVLAAAVLCTWWASAEADGPVGAWFLAALGWPALTAASLPLARAGRRPARAALTSSLLGDGVLLALAWWATGGFDGPVGYLVVLHVVAVTLLASFRTGVKLAVWHSICAMLLLEATAAGLLGPAVPVPVVALGLYLGALWTAALGTASFAAANERELRRRRYDSEVLRELGLAVVSAPERTAVAAALARFARDELAAHRAAVLVHVHDGGPDGPVSALGVVAEVDGDVEVHYPADGRTAGSVVTEAVIRSTTILLRRLDPAADPWLAETLPGAGGLVVVPFAVDQVSGALVLETSPGRVARRVERRIVNAAEQATAHAAIALERAVLTERIRAASETDGLTGVANRRRFDEVLLAEVRRARETGADLALVMIDVDHFKRLNDAHGHLVGDQVLRQVAQAIRAECGEPHLVARYGGEEFAAILIGADAAAAVTMAERIRAGLHAAPTMVPVTASLGVADFATHGSELVAAADAALYRAKEGGRNRVVAAAPAPVALAVAAVSGAGHDASATGTGRR